MGLLTKFKEHYRSVILAVYLLPIIVSVIVSLAHVVTFWDVTNPMSWAIFLSIGIEIGVLSSIAAARLSNLAWIPFIIVTFIQIIGNIFFSYVQVDVNSLLFKQWVELTDPLFNFIGLGTEGDIIVHKRIVAMSGAFVPIIAIVFFNFFIREIRKGVVPNTPPVQPSVEPSETQAQSYIPTNNQTQSAANVMKSMMFASAPPPVNEPVIVSPGVPAVEVDTAEKQPEQPIEPITDEKFYDNINNGTSPAREAIENMTNIDTAKLQEPYMAQEFPEETVVSEQSPEPTTIAQSMADVVDKWEATGVLEGTIPISEELVPEPQQVTEEKQVSEPEKKK